MQLSQRLFFVILNGTLSHNLPYQKVKKIGCRRRPYLQVYRKKSSFDHCVSPKLPEISAAKVQRVRRRITFFAKRNAKCNEHQGRLPCFLCILRFNHQHFFSLFLNLSRSSLNFVTLQSKAFFTPTF